MKNIFISILVCATIGLVSSCTNYKAKLIIEVKDSSDKTLARANVILLKEDKAREFEKGVVGYPDYYKIDSTSSNGIVRMKITNDEPIYGLVGKSGYYYEEFYIESPLSNKSKNKIIVKLGKIDDYALTGKTNTRWIRRPE